MRVYTRNTERNIDEMSEMLSWVIKTFPAGFGIEENTRWTYGKEPDWLGSTFCSGAFDIEWFDFADEKDAEWFILRWK